MIIIICTIFILLYLYCLFFKKDKLPSYIISKKELYISKISHLFIICMYFILLTDIKIIMVILFIISFVSAIIAKIMDYKITKKIKLYYQKTGNIEELKKWERNFDKLQIDILAWIAILIGFSILILISFIKNA